MHLELTSTSFIYYVFQVVALIFWDVYDDVLFVVIAKLQTHFIIVLQQNVTLHLIHVLNLFILEFIFLIIGFMVNVYIFGHPTEKCLNL